MLPEPPDAAVEDVAGADDVADGAGALVTPPVVPEPPAQLPLLLLKVWLVWH